MARYIDAEKLKKDLRESEKLLREIYEGLKYDDERQICAGQITTLVECILRVKEAPAADVVEIPKNGIGNLSDGYHTFNELYHHRAVLFSVICNMFPDKAWKSKLHDTGDMYDGMFIVGIETPDGQATYHYDIEPYWEMFKVKELEKAPKWDGHTPTVALERISTICAEVKHGEWKEHYAFGCWHYDCPFCDDGYATKERDKTPPNYCGNCGAKMDGKRKEEKI